MPSSVMVAARRVAATSASWAVPLSGTANSSGPERPSQSSPRRERATTEVAAARLLVAVGQVSSRRSRPRTISAPGTAGTTARRSARWAETELGPGSRLVTSFSGGSREGTGSETENGLRAMGMTV